MANTTFISHDVRESVGVIPFTEYYNALNQIFHSTITILKNTQQISKIRLEFLRKIILLGINSVLEFWI